MKETDLKKILSLMGIEWSVFKNFMIGKTFTHSKADFYYYESDIKYFFETHLTIKS